MTEYGEIGILYLVNQIARKLGRKSFSGEPSDSDFLAMWEYLAGYKIVKKNMSNQFKETVLDEFKNSFKNSRSGRYTKV